MFYSIDENLTVFHNNLFPYTNPKKSSKKYSVVLGVGGNKGNMFLTLKKLFYYFLQDKRVDILKTSILLQNPPFGYTKQDDFLNTIIVLKTNLSPSEFLKYILSVEKYFGRKRSFKNAPRTLDLDIIFFENFIINKKNLKIPHPQFLQRDSVMIPLSFL